MKRGQTACHRSANAAASRRSPIVEVGTYATRSEAELAQAALIAAGITSRLVADDAGAAYPFDLTGGARLLVDEADVELAAEILGTDRTHTGGSTQ